MLTTGRSDNEGRWWTVGICPDNLHLYTCSTNNNERQCESSTKLLTKSNDMTNFNPKTHFTENGDIEIATSVLHTRQWYINKVDNGRRKFISILNANDDTLRIWYPCLPFKVDYVPTTGRSDNEGQRLRLSTRANNQHLYTPFQKQQWTQNHQQRKF